MKQLLLTMLLVVIPTPLYASVVINEIMYDLEGTDSDREWIEIKNIGSDEIDLSSWKFFENGSNHSLGEYQGGVVLGPGDFAIISDVPDVFLSDWPSYSGILLDSSWSSFSNTGETFSIKNEDGDIVDEVAYSPDDGADGDGNSLQLIDGAFLPASPTPGAANQLGSQEEIAEDPVSGGGPTIVEEEVDSSKKQNTFGIPSRVFTGQKIEFVPEIYDNEGNKIFKARFVWSFGNGGIREDEYRKDFAYTYNHPGTYVIHLSVFEHSYSREPDHVYRQTVTVLEPSITITAVDSGVKLVNSSVYEVDLDDWEIESGDNLFKIPPYTILLPGKSIIFSEEVLGFDTSKNISLLNTEGAIVDMLAQETLPKKPAKTIERATYQQPVYLPEPVKKIVSNFDNDLVPSESQLASAASAVGDREEEKNSKAVWYVVYAVLLLSVVGVIAYIYFKDESEFIDEINGSDKEAEDYTFE